MSRPKMPGVLRPNAKVYVGVWTWQCNGILSVVVFAEFNCP
jgi:hypothetical protein